MLQECYDRPHLLHEAHVCEIVQAPSLNDGSGKELHGLHDILALHLRTLKVMNYEPDLFITSLTELKLDHAIAFEWQRHIQGTLKLSHHSELIKLLDLWAQASKFTTH